MKPLLIFGTGQLAEVAAFYFRHDSQRSIAAFTVDGDYLEGDRFCAAPSVAFEQLPGRFPPGDYDAFVALSYAKLNRVRAEKFAAMRALGYDLVSYISSKATVWPGFAPAANNFILEHNTIQPFARIGENVTLWSGNHIGHHALIGDHCFLASQIVVSGGVSIGECCFIGVNASLRDHISIGPRCVIGAGALLTADAAADGVYTAPASERSRVPSSRLRAL